MALRKFMISFILCACYLTVNSNDISFSKPKFLQERDLSEADLDIQTLVKESHLARKKRAVAAGGAGNSLSNEEQLILDTHHYYRNLAGAPNMKTLQWDDDLATMASRVADNCVWKHIIYTVRDDWDGAIGQNLYGSLSDKATGKNGVDSWAREQQFYDLSSGECADGRVCWHFTQVVAADTEYVGCAANTCPLLDVGVRT